MAGHGFDVTEYGARGGDGDTDAFQGAIDACAERGGGTVHVPSGEYVTGTIELRSHVTLHLDAGAAVHASQEASDYRDYVGVPGEATPYLVATGAENVAITGRGSFDGHATDLFDVDEPIREHGGRDAGSLVSNAPPEPRQGEDFLDPSAGTEEWPVARPDFRPGPMFLFFDCEGVAVDGVTFRDMPQWTISLKGCDGATVSGVDVRNHPLVPNSDGISVFNSRDVRVSDCSIRACDDAIVPGTDARIEGPTENVTVTNCTLSSHACAIKFGSETERDIRNVTVSNCTIYASNRGLGIQHRDAGDVENVLFSNLTVETSLSPGPWWGKAEPIYVTSVPRTEDTDLGTVRNVRFSNIVASGENGALVYGSEEAHIEDLRFDRVGIRLRDSDANEAVGGNFDLQPTATMAPIFEHDVPGIFCRGVEGLTLSDADVEWEADLPEFFTHALQCEAVSGLTVDGLRGGPAHPDRGDAAVRLRETVGITVRNCRAGRSAGAFLSLSDTDDERLFANNDLTEAGGAIEGDESFVRSGNTT